MHIGQNGGTEHRDIRELRVERRCKVLESHHSLQSTAMHAKATLNTA